LSTEVKIGCLPKRFVDMAE